MKPGSGESFKDCAECPEMVVVPAGRFMMGSPSTEALRDETEGPQHEVLIRNPIAVGKFEITFDQWDACVDAGGCTSNQSPDDEGWWPEEKRPVINVSWEDAKEYIRWISAKTGKNYRLLSESEWEYIARSGSGDRFFFGEEAIKLKNYAIYYSNSSGKTWPVGSKAANPWGLYDIYGNVYEWVEDCWSKNYDRKSHSEPVSGSPWRRGKCNSRVIRGGSWEPKSYSGFNTTRRLRSASRNGANSTLKTSDIGFRVSRKIIP
jgi:formylglycine-generating enzyme required for sulfatase activity